MIRALRGIEKLHAQARNVYVSPHRGYNPGWHAALDLKSLLTVSEAVARSALDRQESRGAHFRDDYPGQDEVHSRRHTVIRKGPDGEMQVVHEVNPPLRDDLKQIIEENR